VKTEFKPNETETIVERIAEMLRHSLPVLLRRDQARLSATVSHRREGRQWKGLGE
jgi:hypothetical protein